MAAYHWGLLKVTCKLTACTPGSAPGPTLGNEYGRTLPLPIYSLNNYSSKQCEHSDNYITGDI